MLMPSVDKMARSRAPLADGSDHMIRLLQQSCDAFEQAVQLLQAHFPPPTLVERAQGIPEFRHDRCDDLLMSYLKCVRCVSLLRAGTVLLGGGFYQEVGILCRCLSESFEDVLFLAEPLGGDKKPSEPQKRLVAEFYQEEFDNPAKPVSSQPPRDRVKRDEVLAGIARIPGNPLNPSDMKAFTRMLHHGFSGYIHGAYPHIMELFGAPPDAEGKAAAAHGRFYMTGKMPEQRLNQMAEALASRAHNTALAITVVAKRVNDKAIVDRLEPVLDALSKATGSDVGDPNKAAKGVKAGKSLG
jgi:hypothetical protein